MTKKEQSIEAEGIVTKALGGDKFLVKLKNSEHEIQAYISGKMRKFYIKIVPGDEVTVAISPYDLGKGRIIYRER
jgi:translation initiation factor IF-1